MNIGTWDGADIVLDVVIRIRGCGYASARLPEHLLDTAVARQLARADGTVAEVHFSHSRIDAVSDEWTENAETACVALSPNGGITHVLVVHSFCVVARSAFRPTCVDAENPQCLIRGVGARLMSQLLRLVPSAADRTLIMLGADGHLVERSCAHETTAELERVIATRGIAIADDQHFDGELYRAKLEHVVNHIRENEDLVDYYVRKFDFVEIARVDWREVLLATTLARAIARSQNTTRV